MAFPERDAEQLMAACHRRCCLCHRFCGVKMELDHMEPKSEGGSDDIDNAIAVCFECHAEIHCYNDQHPRGRKFRPSELRQHKEQWLSVCRDQPRMLLDARRDSDVGPLQAMIDELEYNLVAAERLGPTIEGGTFSRAGGLFRDEQFTRAVSEGAISILDDSLRSEILDAYSAVGELKQLTIASIHQSAKEQSQGFTNSQVMKCLQTFSGTLTTARMRLLDFLAQDRD